MARETKTTIIRQIHEKHYTFNGKSFKPKDYFKSWCEDNNNTLAISRLNIKDLIRYRDFMSKDNDSDSDSDSDGDSDSDDDTDWDKTPREVAPRIPFLPNWVKEEGKRLTDAKKVPPPIPFLPDWVREESRKHIKSRVGNISVNFSPDLLKAMELKRKN